MINGMGVAVKNEMFEIRQADVNAIYPPPTFRATPMSPPAFAVSAA